MPTQSSQQKAETSPLLLSERIQQNSWFRHLAARIKQVKQLQYIFLQVVDRELGQQCQILEFHNGQLNLAANNAVWATQVRYAAPELIKSLRLYPEFHDLTAIHCYVYPDSQATQTKSIIAPNPIPAESANCIAEVAKGIKDVRLKNALLKLAGRHPDRKKIVE